MTMSNPEAPPLALEVLPLMSQPPGTREDVLMAGTVLQPALAGPAGLAEPLPPVHAALDPALPPAPVPARPPEHPVPPNIEPPLEVDGQLLINDRLERLRKAEAASLRHLMTHHPKNAYCKTRCLAKVQNFL